VPQGQSLPGPAVNKNMPFLPVPHIMPQHLAGIAGKLHGLGCTRDVAPGPAVVLALGLGKGDLAGGAVPQLDLESILCVFLYHNRHYMLVYDLDIRIFMYHRRNIF
jgi:hypothetical protein